MLNDTSIAIIHFFLGLMLGTLAPGFIGQIGLLIRKVGLSLKLLTGFLRAVLLFLVIAFVVLIFIGIIDVPVDHPSLIWLGFGVFAGLIGGSLALIVAFIVARKRSARVGETP